MKTRVLHRSPLGRIEATLLTQLSTHGKVVFTIEDAQKMIPLRHGHLRETLSGLARKRWIDRIKRGVYLILPFGAGVEGKFTQHELVIAAHLVQPYYISYWSAFSYYQWTEQIPGTVCIATTKARQDLMIHGVRYRFVQMKKEKFFGFTKSWIENQKVCLAEKEKAIIDSLDRPDVCGGIVEVAKCLWNARKELDWSKVVNYGIKAGNRAALQRLGFMVERFKIDIGKELDCIQKHISRSYARLDPTASKRGRHVKRWRVLVNVSEQELQGWRMH